MRGMECTLAVLADAANVEENGKLNILGCFDTINSKAFPCRHERCTVVVRFSCNPAEYGKKKEIELILLDADGKHLFEAHTNLTIPDNGSRVHQVRGLYEMELLPLPKAGDYAFAILVGGETKATIPFTCALVEDHENQA